MASSNVLKILYVLDMLKRTDEFHPINSTEIIQKLEAGEAIDPVTVVVDQAFVAPGITSQYATTMTQEVLDGRAY